MRLVLLIGLLSVSLLASPPVAPMVPTAAQASANFDARAATDAWLATVPASARAKSDAYFEGGYWLILWDFLFNSALMVLLLETKLSARMRDWADKLTRLRWLESFFYWIQFIIVIAVLTFPLTVYEGFLREHKYGLLNQTFMQWLSEQLIGLALGVVLGGLAFTALFAIVRRLPGTWHIWGAAVAIVFLAIGIVIGPVFIAPLFNTYRPLPNSALKQQILSLGRENGIPATDVYEMDASKQSNRVSANVSGFLGTERITLNDNLLDRCSSAAVMATMGHEMGHYVLGHIYNAVIFFVIVVAVMFSVLRWALTKALARWGTRWQVYEIGDVAVLPLAVLILSTMGFVFTPIANSFTREQEYQADIFGINASRQPDGEAEVDLLLGEYRKLDPGPFEEMIFFDHPSGRTRIYAAMRWKAENLCLIDAALPCKSKPQR